MTQLNISIDDVEPDTIAAIFKALGVSPDRIKGAKVDGSSIRIPPPTPIEPVGWNAETARLLVGGLTQTSHRALTILCDNDGVAHLDDMIAELGLGSGKALGGVMSSIGHNVRALVEAGRLPEGEEIYIRDEEARVLQIVTTRRVLHLLTAACHRRAQEEADRGVSAVA